MNCIVFKISDNLKNKLIKFYDSFMCDKKPPYSVFQAKNYDVTITLYESGKVMFQGIGADIEASIWIDAEKRLNNRIIDTNKKEKKEKEKKKDDNDFFFNVSTIGSDETGCGDFFGPIVVCSTYVSKENIPFLEELGVKDSKKINDDKIMEIVPKIIKKIPYVCFILDNESYNNNYQDMNMVKLKCILHNKVLYNLIEKYKPNYKYCVIDQFVNSKKYYEYLLGIPKVVKNISFYTKAESKCMAVAAASVIARYVFLTEMKKLDEMAKMRLQKGASQYVDKQILELIEKHGKDFLKKIAKLNFKNYTKL
ncbi:MAG: ribonuclease HIII [Mollicutes bacterium]|nr:ribonuclease HIII [Mollicutes bacterium]